MTDRTATTLSAATAPTLPGTWKLPRGRAVTLRPASDGILRVAHGRLWATKDGPHGGTPFDAGDHVLEVGRSMVVRAGERVVIEAWMPAGASYFAWDPLVETATVAVRRRRINFSAVRQPLADLRLASAMLLRALASLGTGLVQVASQAVHVRGSGHLPRRGATV
ncbi:DUF2917 domain-containing protein [Ramlibacter alkalitolerans]|uniref:DUF2917 domain-containing protein n=1 Tax=Ramlibacter alkalitolerans TaxID=2039631 RepID=A0ABS1JQ46_9BURK|nr:DUF2917 domain-containing protein [Ramlibacter alkalitolerans]MBL0426389.1 DUF2917 domain-containing protein [Ramlibacter alkalitolerans]